MNNDNGFDIFVNVVFATSPQLGVFGPIPQDRLIYLFLGEGETLPQFYLRAL